MALPPSLDLPSIFRLARLREGDSAFATAIAGAAEAGAGAFLLVRSFHRFDAAVILEPSVPLVRSRHAIYAGVNAMIDALAALGPPQKPVGLRWPDTIELDGAVVGGARLAVPVGTQETDLPDWLVLGVTVLTAWPPGAPDPGRHPDVTALAEEGFDDEATDNGRLAEAFARYFLAAISDWQASGDDELNERTLARLVSPRSARRSIDRAGDLVLTDAAGASVRMGLGARLDRQPAWLQALEPILR